ncbi:tetratricopeptide repeat protein [Phenylobacterium sp.]|uniref:tetratricopeptide repeat protein n=1 Tax=Phenylobacterium sp. TaxID=1871053 RepID=UPI0025D86366|nr:tetratricopeptide repeat protein [Phenylobacterium sp.]
MKVKDHHGLELTGASAAAAGLYQKALDAYHCYAGDAMTPLAAALSESPGCVMGYVLQAWMTLIGSNAETAAMGAQAFAVAKDLPGANAREQGHLAAIGSLLAGEVRTAARLLEDVNLAWPRDVLALQVGQTLDFLLGDARMLRDRIVRVLPAWTADTPGWHAIQGLLSFGYEEAGDYARAEACGREAIALQPRNNWAQHGVAHALLMQGRHADGVRWMRHENEAWQAEAMLGVHNWWHTALFHIGLGETEEVLRLYDGPIYGAATTFSFDMVDAAAMLWRLKLAGVDVGDRWAGLADNFAREPAGLSAFVDTHAMMAYVGAGREAQARALLETQSAALNGPGDNAYFVREVGQPAIQALHAFGQGRYGQATDLLRGLRGKHHRFGGSHAQRDVLDLTLLSAARLSGDDSLHAALLAERDGAQPLTTPKTPAIAA